MAHSQSSVDLWVRNSQLENYDYDRTPEQSSYDYYTPHSHDTSQAVAEEPGPIVEPANIRYSLGPETSSMMHDVLLLPTSVHLPIRLIANLTTISRRPTQVGMKFVIG